MTADRVYNIVKARADKRKEVAEDAQQRKEQRIEKERDGQRALAAEGEQVKVGEVADLDALKVRELQAWLAYKDPTGWSEHSLSI